MRVMARRVSRGLDPAFSVALPLAASNVPYSSASTPPPPDIRAIVQAQPYLLPADYLWPALCLAGALLAGWLVWRLLLRRRPRPRGRRQTPRERAIRRLLDLEGQAEGLDPGVFGAQVCDVLRTYIGAQYGVHPERQTSTEFVASIANASVFPDAQKSLLAEFLEQCDLLKFARLDATREAKRRLLAQANEFLQSSSTPLATTPVP